MAQWEAFVVVQQEVSVRRSAILTRVYVIIPTNVGYLKFGHDRLLPHSNSSFPIHPTTRHYAARATDSVVK